MTKQERRDVLVLKNMDLVRAIARKMVVGLPPCFDAEELISAGYLGLIDAAGKFKPGRRVKFGTYAGSRIRGAMLDSIRRRNWTMATSPPLEDVAIEPSHTPAPILSIDQAKKAKTLRLALEALEPRERTLMIEHYFRGQLLSVSGTLIGVKTTRTTQIHATALRKMKEALRRMNVDKAA